MGTPGLLYASSATFIRMALSPTKPHLIKGFSNGTCDRYRDKVTEIRFQNFEIEEVLPSYDKTCLSAISSAIYFRAVVVWELAAAHSNE